MIYTYVTELDSGNRLVVFSGDTKGGTHVYGEKEMMPEDKLFDKTAGDFASGIYDESGSLVDVEAVNPSI